MQRETIIQLAAEMFVGQGIKAVRMDDIARHIGVSKRTIYEQFGDKEELLYQCLSYYVREQDRRHAELGAQAKNVLVFLVVNFLRGISTEKGMRLIDDFLEKQNGKK